MRGFLNGRLHRAPLRSTSQLAVHHALTWLWLSGIRASCYQDAARGKPRPLSVQWCVVPGLRGCDTANAMLMNACITMHASKGVSKVTVHEWKFVSKITVHEWKSVSGSWRHVGMAAHAGALCRQLPFSVTHASRGDPCWAHVLPFVAWAVYVKVQLSRRARKLEEATRGEAVTHALMPAGSQAWKPLRTIALKSLP